MNVVHVITRLIIGGAQENTILTCRRLIDLGHDVLLIAGPETGPEGSLWNTAEAAGCELYTVSNLCRRVSLVQDLRARREIADKLRAWSPDVVHTHSSKAGILGRSAAARAVVPVVVHTIHGMSFNRTQPRMVQWLYRTLERRAARHTTMFVCVADAMTTQAVEAGIAERKRFITIRSGMETDRFAPDQKQRARVRAEWGVLDDDIVVGTIARLFKNKGYEEIIEAMPSAIAQEPRLQFVWIGDGAHRERYEQRLSILGLRDRVHMVGLIPPTAVPGKLNGFDILLHASRWEGLPRAVVQAMLIEVPPISFDNDGAPEVVIPNETGLLVPFQSTGTLADPLVTLAQDAPLRHRLGRQGRQRMLNLYDWRNMVDQLESLYESLVTCK